MVAISLIVTITTFGMLVYLQRSVPLVLAGLALGKPRCVQVGLSGIYLVNLIVLKLRIVLQRFKAASVNTIMKFLMR